MGPGAEVGLIDIRTLSELNHDAAGFWALFYLYPSQ
jgi:hypothetical protein